MLSGVIERDQRHKMCLCSHSFNSSAVFFWDFHVNNSRNEKRKHLKTCLSSICY